MFTFRNQFFTALSTPGIDSSYEVACKCIVYQCLVLFLSMFNWCSESQIVSCMYVLRNRLYSLCLLTCLLGVSSFCCSKCY